MTRTWQYPSEIIMQPQQQQQTTTNTFQSLSPLITAISKLQANKVTKQSECWLDVVAGGKKSKSKNPSKRLPVKSSRKNWISGRSASLRPKRRRKKSACITDTKRGNCVDHTTMHVTNWTSVKQHFWPQPHWFHTRKPFRAPATFVFQQRSWHSKRVFVFMFIASVFTRSCY